MHLLYNLVIIHFISKISFYYLIALLIINWSLESLYTSEKHGDDTTGDGSESKPFKSVLKAMKAADKEPFPRE